MKDTPIIPAKTAIKSLRDSGYKNCAAALAELIDNSIEAKAKNINILVFEKSVTQNNRPNKKISEIVIYDDGIGMNDKILEKSLQFGNGEKLQSRKGIGRFGMGLPMASISQCQNVQAYSWNNDLCFHTYLDVIEVEKNAQQNINPVTKKDVPDYISKELKISKTGTIIIWSNFDRMKIARGETLYRRMSKQLCRTFRYYLDKKNSFGNKINMNFKVVGEDFEEEFKPDDPIYLMTPNNTPGYENESVMELKSIDNDERSGVIEVQYTNPITNKPDISKVLFKFTYIKRHIWDKETDGRSAFQTHLKNNQGISFVREGREIDFGNFGYYTLYDLTDRYWGCEIQFEPVLDEYFGVSIDKQGVREMGPLRASDKKDEGLSDEEIENDPKKKIRSEITRRFDDIVKKYKDIFKLAAKGSRTNGGKKTQAISERIFKKRKVLTRSAIEAGTKSEDQINEEYKKRAEQIAKLTGVTYTPDQLKKIIEEKKKLEVDVELDSWEGSQFFTIEVIGKTATVKLNVNHRFHNKLYENLAKELDTTNVEIVDFMLMAWTRVEDELSVTSIKKDDFTKIREKWGQILTELLEEQEQLLN